MKATLIEGVVRPRTQNGVDWSRPRRVLIRRGTRELWWMGAGVCWAGDGRHVVKSELRMIELSHDNYQRSLGEQLGEEGGRLTVDRLFKALPKIADFFDYVPSAQHLSSIVHPRKMGMMGHVTLLLEEVPRG